MRKILAGLIASSLWPMYVHAGTEGQFEAGAAVKHNAPRHVAGSSIDNRIKILSKALDLDAKQQIELRTVLESQREQVRRVWSDESVPAAYRVSATKAIENRTADRIRALLNDEQKKKYNPPRPPHEAAGSSPGVEDWMNRTWSK